MAIFENFPYSNFHEINLDWMITTMKALKERVDYVTVDVDAFIAQVLAEVSPEKITEIVDQYFADHPEMYQYLNLYVTPQDYGAVADGVTDDTQAVQQALNSGADVYFPKGTYAVTSLLVTSRNNWTLDASNAIIIGTGIGFTWRFRTLHNCKLILNEVESSGGCIVFQGSTSSESIDNVTLEFNKLKPAAAYQGILFSLAGSSTARHIIVKGGLIDGGADGVRFEINTGTATDFTFRDVLIKDVTNCYNMMGSAVTDILESLRIDLTGYDPDECSMFLTRTTGKLKNVWVTCPVEIPDAQMSVGGGSNIRVGFDTGDKYYDDTRGYWSHIDGYCTGLLQGGYEIPANSNLNSPTYCKPGEYWCTSVSGLSNCPTAYIFHMTVRTVIRNWNPDTSSSNYIHREIFDMSSTETMYRQYVSYNGGSWTYGAWKKVVPVNA